MDDFFDERRRFRLSLHQLTALDVQPGELIAMAGALGCAHVCLFTHVPEQARGIYPIVTEENILAIASQMARHNVTICNIEVFPLDGGRLGDFESGLTVGATLGATRATAHIHDADHPTAVARFAEFCDMAARYGIRAGLEFNAFSAVKDIHAATAIVREAARPNGSLVLDMLHLFRSGGVASDVAVAADLIEYAQLSDGPLDMADDTRWHEAVRERMIPGEGQFPIAEVMRHLAPGTIIEIEVPQTAARKAGVGALERARRAVDGARRMVDAIPESVGAR